MRPTAPLIASSQIVSGNTAGLACVAVHVRRSLRSPPSVAIGQAVAPHAAACPGAGRALLLGRVASARRLRRQFRSASAPVRVVRGARILGLRVLEVGEAVPLGARPYAGAVAYALLIGHDRLLVVRCRRPTCGSRRSPRSRSSPRCPPECRTGACWGADSQSPTGRAASAC